MTAIPDEFVCPLTLELYQDPLMTRNGLNYERSAIIEWLDRGNHVCPMTRQPLNLAGLVHNSTLRLRMQAWKEENGYESELEDCARMNKAGFITVARVDAKCLVKKSQELLSPRQRNWTSLLRGRQQSGRE